MNTAIITNTFDYSSSETVTLFARSAIKSQTFRSAFELHEEALVKQAYARIIVLADDHRGGPVARPPGALSLCVDLLCLPTVQGPIIAVNVTRV